MSCDTTSELRARVVANSDQFKPLVRFYWPFQGSTSAVVFVFFCCGVSLSLCCFVVYSTRRFVLCFTLCHFVLVFFSPFSTAITSLGEERELILVLFVRLFNLWLFGFVGFLFLLVSVKGCGLWLLHFLDFSFIFFFTYSVVFIYMYVLVHLFLFLIAVWPVFDNILKQFSYFFSENRFWHYMQLVSVYRLLKLPREWRLLRYLKTK